MLRELQFPWWQNVKFSSLRSPRADISMLTLKADNYGYTELDLN